MLQVIVYILLSLILQILRLLVAFVLVGNVFEKSSVMYFCNLLSHFHYVNVDSQR